jgi:hypothetical protein
VPEPGAGVNVDPLGEGLIKVFPDGFRALFAPAAALPAPVPMPLVERSVELPGVVVDGPVVDGPVVPPLVVEPPVEVPPPLEPVPVCASAKVLANVNAAANPILMSFMIPFLCW